jgi:hypothetical protein
VNFPLGAENSSGTTIGRFLDGAVMSFHLSVDPASFGPLANYWFYNEELNCSLLYLSQVLPSGYLFHHINYRGVSDPVICGFCIAVRGLRPLAFSQ